MTKYCKFCGDPIIRTIGSGRLREKCHKRECFLSYNIEYNHNRPGYDPDAEEKRKVMWEFRRARILELREKDLTYAQIGKELGISTQRAYIVYKRYKNND